MDTTTGSETTQAQHTPGPWAAEWDEDEGCHVIRMGSAVANRGSYPAEEIIRYEHGLYSDENSDATRAQFARAEANAALIASAPAMRAKLDRASSDLSEIVACLDVVIENGSDPQTPEALSGIRKALDAIAKGLR